MDKMDKVAEIVKQLAAALSVPAEKVWDALVALQIIGSWTILANTLIGVAVCAALAYAARRAFKYAAKDGGGAEELGSALFAICGILSAVCGLTALLGVLFGMREMITGFAAPEAGAVLEILSKLGR